MGNYCSETTPTRLTKAKGASLPREIFTSNFWMSGLAISALDTIASLKPSAVGAGHKRRGRDDEPSILEETRQYSRDFDRIAAEARTPEEV